MNNKIGIVSALGLIVFWALYFALKSKFHLLTIPGLVAVISGLTLIVF